MTGRYDLLLVVLSILVAVVAASVALDLAGRVAAARGRRVAAYWLAGGAVSMGSGIWSMHFIGMLAFTLPVPMAYDIGITVASLLVAVAASGFALGIVSRSTLEPRVLVGAGVVMGCAIAGMHFLGMAAMDMAPIRYRPPLVVASIAIAVGASILALRTSFALRTETILSAFRRKIGSAVIMGAAISGMHYVGMAAAVFPPMALHASAADGMSNHMLAIIVGASAFLLLAATLALSMIDAHLAARASSHVADLSKVNGALAGQAAELAQVNARLQAEVTERMRSEARAHRLAYHDALTGLPNRACFSQMFNRSLAQAAREEGGLALMFIDLDRFKVINDTLGHEAGDALLKEVALRLTRCIREPDVVARLGGDEFVILLPDILDPEHAAGVAQAVLATLLQPYRLLGQALQVTASIGISVHPADGEDERTLMRHADVAMYRAKADGKNNVRFYHRGMDEHALHRLEMEASLRHALACDELLLQYQPKLDAADGCITGLEALLRWRHPRHGVILPAAFLPLAEETGLIVPIGNWVMRTACTQYADWRARGFEPGGMAVNLSARQFADEHLARDVSAILSACGMDPARLELEIAERTLMHDPGATARVLAALAATGVHVTIDDFGAGYASLATLDLFPVDAVKLDRAVLRGLRGASASQPVADAILAMGRALSMSVTAGGVETIEQADYLRRQRCTPVQGFHLGDALSAQDVEVLLDRAHH